MCGFRNEADRATLTLAVEPRTRVACSIGNTDFGRGFHFAWLRKPATCGTNSSRTTGLSGALAFIGLTVLAVACAKPATVRPQSVATHDDAATTDAQIGAPDGDEIAAVPDGDAEGPAEDVSTAPDGAEVLAEDSMSEVDAMATEMSAPCPACDDGNPCTTDLCPSGSCSHGNADGLACDDDDLCTENDACHGGVCAGLPLAWQVQWPAELVGGHSVTDLAPGPDQGWYLTDVVTPAGENVQWRIVRLDVLHKEVWAKVFGPPLRSVTRTTAGVAAILNATGGSLVVFLDAAGKQLGQYPVPMHAMALLADGADVIVAGTDKSIEPTAVMVSRLTATGVLGASAVMPSSPAQVSLAPGPGGTVKVGVRETQAANVFRVYSLDAKLAKVQEDVWQLPSGHVAKEAHLVWTPGVGYAVTGYLDSVFVYPVKPLAYGCFVAMPGQDGKLAWIQPIEPAANDFAIPVPSVAVRLAGGDVEAIHGAVRVRFAVDGSLRWSRGYNNGGVNQAMPGAIGHGSAVGNGVVTVAQGLFDNASLYNRLARSDAFGNLTCLESGPCADKPASYCADNDPCTSDRCDAVHGGCWHDPLQEGAPCKPGMSCKAGSCKP